MKHALLLSALSLASFVASSPGSFAQTMQAWRHDFDGASGRLIAAHPGGGVVVASAASSAPDGDAYVLRYDAAGALLWSYTFDTGLGIREDIRALAVDPSGNVFVGGLNNGMTPNGFVADAWTFRLDATGILVWSQRYPEPTVGPDHVVALALDANGAVYAAGSSKSAGPTFQYDLFVAKYDIAGNLIYDARWDGSLGLRELPTAITVDASGAAYVTGTANYDGVTATMMLVKVAPNGSIAWATENAHGGVGPSAGNSVTLDAAGDVLVCGSYGNTSTVAADPVVLKHDAAGNLVWLRTLTGASTLASEVQVDPRGDLIVIGLGTAPFTPVYEWLWKLDPASNVLWARSRSETYNSGRLVLDAGGGIFSSGYASSGGPVFGRVGHWSRDGEYLWTHQLELCAGLLVGGIVDPSGAIFAVGYDAATFTLRLDPAATALCFGDGSGTACPCANASAPHETAGCASSLGVGGRLEAAGVASIALDSLVLIGSAIPNRSVLYFQGSLATSGGAGSAFGDGLRCAGGTVVRLGSKTNAAGTSRYPAGADAAISVQGPVPPNATRWYKAWYRNAASFCTSATFNLTNAVAVTWQA